MDEISLGKGIVQHPILEKKEMRHKEIKLTKNSQQFRSKDISGDQPAHSALLIGNPGDSDDP